MTPTDGTALRPIRPDDLEALGQVAFAGGFFEVSAGRYVPAQALFCDLWARPYQGGPGCCNLVAEGVAQILKDTRFGR